MGIAPAGPDGSGGKDSEYPPAGDGATHTGTRPFDRARSRMMREFNDMEQPPQGPVYVDPRHNLHMPTRYAMSWFGGLIPNQPLPDWMMASATNSDRFHAPAGRSIFGDRGGAKPSKQERGKGVLFPTAVVNPSLYLRHGGAVPIGIGPAQVQEFHASTDAVHPETGNGPGTAYANAPFMAGGFAAVMKGNAFGSDT